MNDALSKDPMMQPCRSGCGELVHLENDGFHVCREQPTSNANTGVGQGADATTAATEPVRRPDSLPSNPKLQTRLREIAESLLCRGGSGHYCPNCDNTTFDAAMSLKLLADQLGAPDETISPLDFHPRWRAAVQGYMGEGELWEIVCEMGEEVMRLRGVTHRSEKATGTPPFAIGTRVRFIDAASDHVEWVVYRLHDGWVYLHASDDRTYTHCAKPEKLRAVEGSGCCGDVTHGCSPNGNGGP